MSDAQVSRRDAMRLARFGALLAVGLGVAESGSAQQLKGLYDSRLVKGEIGQMLVKFYGVEQKGFTLLKTTELKGLSTSMVKGASFTLKFWKDGVPIVSISDVMVKT